MAKAPVYLFLGPDAAKKREAVAQVLRKHKIGAEPDDPARVVFVAKEDGADEIFEECGTFPFFGGMKAVIVHEAERLPAARLKAYLADPLPSTVLLLLSDLNQGKFGAAVEKQVAALGEVAMFWQPFESELARLAETRARAAGMQPPRAFGDFITHLAGRNAALIEQYVDLLSNAFGGQAFSAEQAEEALAARREATAFGLVDMACRGKKKDALLAYRRLVEEGEEPIRLAALFRMQFEKLWLYGISPSNCARESKMALRDLEGQSRRLGHDKLARAFEALAPLELSLKGDPEPLKHARFELFLYEVAG